MSSSRHDREKFEEFARRVLAVPKAALDARLVEEKKRKRTRARAKRPPPVN